MIGFIIILFYAQMMMEKTEVREGEELRVSCLARDEFHCFCIRICTYHSCLFRPDFLLLLLITLLSSFKHIMKRGKLFSCKACIKMEWRPSGPTPQCWRTPGCWGIGWSWTPAPACRSTSQNSSYQGSTWKFRQFSRVAGPFSLKAVRCCPNR